jgi:transcriptional/translational regulatory protein YebC/TACO1
LHRHATFGAMNHIFLDLKTIDSEDEMMMHLLMEEEANVAADEDEHFMILVGLLQLEHAVSKFERKKSKLRERLEVHIMLYTDYFIEVHT